MAVAVPDQSDTSRRDVLELDGQRVGSLWFDREQRHDGGADTLRGEPLEELVLLGPHDEARLYAVVPQEPLDFSMRAADAVADEIDVAEVVERDARSAGESMIEVDDESIRIAQQVDVCEQVLAEDGWRGECKVKRAALDAVVDVVV
jgi:hypothetical protein